MVIAKDTILQWLSTVKDPEIPVLSLLDLGVIRDVTVHDDVVTIEMTPTFVGCPALDVMQSEIRATLNARGIGKVNIHVSFDPPWTSDLISEHGRQALREFGMAPPPSRELFHDLEILERVACPRCGTTDTEIRNAFGPTLCRSIHYCNHCREAFEQFKPL